MARSNPDTGLVFVQAHLWGPSENMVVEMALDTGATSTLISHAILRFLGYDPALSAERVNVTTGSGIEFAPRLSISKLEALDLKRENLPVIVHTLPPSASVDGLLGLDFFRGHRLTLEFLAGEITLE